jgi:hypothetical protein
MFRYKIQYTTLAILWAFGLSAQNVDHIFVYLENITEEAPKITYGNFKEEDNLLKKDKIYKDEKTFYVDVKYILEKLPKERQNILVHIHGLWADTKPFYEEANYILQKKVYNTPESKYGLVISLQWKGSINYIDDYEITDQAGHLFEPIIDKVNAMARKINPDYQMAFFNHSMGNRVFHSILTHDYSSEEQIDVDLILLVAADLKDTILSEPVMNYYVTQADKTVVFFNKEDRTLKVAKKAVPGERLGISGPRQKDQLPDSVQLIEATNFNDFETWPGKISKHRYYYDSDTTRQIINSILSTR